MANSTPSRSQLHPPKGFVGVLALWVSERFLTSLRSLDSFFDLRRVLRRRSKPLRVSIRQDVAITRPKSLRSLPIACGRHVFIAGKLCQDSISCLFVTLGSIATMLCRSAAKPWQLRDGATRLVRMGPKKSQFAMARYFLVPAGLLIQVQPSQLHWKNMPSQPKIEATLGGEGPSRLDRLPQVACQPGA